jgi:hypothetical protein
MEAGKLFAAYYVQPLYNFCVNTKLDAEKFRKQVIWNFKIWHVLLLQ